MDIKVDNQKPWYHGSNVLFDTLLAGSTITQWRDLAEAFSHKPTQLSYNEAGEITHDGREYGYLYVVDEPVTVDEDIYQHPNTTMDLGAEFLTKRPLRLRLIGHIGPHRVW